MLEAGVQQFQEWGDYDQGRHILIAVAVFDGPLFNPARAAADGRYSQSADARR
jgi:hypothetical protein